MVNIVDLVVSIVVALAVVTYFLTLVAADGAHARADVAVDIRGLIVLVVAEVVDVNCQVYWSKQLVIWTFASLELFARVT